MNSKQDLAEYWIRNGIIKDNRVIKAFMHVKRELFVSEEYKLHAYGDYPVPIPGGQTISQPTTVMMMTEALDVKIGNKILEVGAGSGYQAAILSKLVGNNGKVITTEIVEELIDYANSNINRAGIKNVKIIHYDGSQGYSKEAPYDRIIVTAACPSMPEPLVKQLKENGIIVAPIGSRYSQEVIKGRKIKDELVTETLGDFVFVPLRGKYGFD